MVPPLEKDDHASRSDAANSDDLHRDVDETESPEEVLAVVIERGGIAPEARFDDGPEVFDLRSARKLAKRQ